MLDIYKNSVKFEDEVVLLRFVDKKDVQDLLKVYSDESAVPFFNSDNCHGDDFYYTSEKRMLEAIEYWQWEYDRNGFVRWSIIDKYKGCVIGTMELFHRDAEDYYTNCGILRIDLRSDYEQKEIIENILSLVVDSAFLLFDCDKVATKAIPEAENRRNALQDFGFTASNKKLVGHNNKEYEHYFVYRK